MPTNQSTRWKVKKLIVAAMLALAFPVAYALDDPQVAEFVSEMNSEHGFDTEWLNGLFADAEAKQKILDAISRPAERTKPWHEYREIFITPKRISAGVAFWREHEKLLDRVERQTGVPARMIVAILGVETYYGRITGGYRVIDALSTLAFLYPPRAKFFRSELEQFLLLTVPIDRIFPYDLGADQYRIAVRRIDVAIRIHNGQQVGAAREDAFGLAPGRISILKHDVGIRSQHQTFNAPISRSTSGFSFRFCSKVFNKPAFWA